MIDHFKSSKIINLFDNYEILIKSQSSKINIKGELRRENKLISYERAFKMLKKDMFITGIGQAVLELSMFKVGSGNTKWESPYFRNSRESSEI